MDVFLYSDLDDEGVAERLWQGVRDRGYCIIDFDVSESIFNWEATFRAAFALSLDAKEGAGVYRNDQGVALGFRKEDQREFFETRLYRGGSGGGGVRVSPSFAADVPSYDTVVEGLFSALSRVSLSVLSALCRGPGLDARAIADLTDLAVAKSEGPSGDAAPREISSSLLRVCYYPPTDAPTPLAPTLSDDPPLPPPATATDPSDAQVAFGSHTDTSFLTIGLLSSSPGLEVLDQRQGAGWTRLEEEAAKIGGSGGGTGGDGRGRTTLRSVVFVGEFLEVATRKFYRALVHRVRAPASSYPRVSCPFIIRGRGVFDMNNAKYTHRAGAESWLPDLDGISVKTLHKMMDFKRQKVMNAPRPDGEDWVLMSYPEDAALPRTDDLA